MFLTSSCSCLCPIHSSHVLSREWRCSRSSGDRRCSNYIFILNLTFGFNGLGKGNCKTRRETFVFWDCVRLKLETWRSCLLKIEVPWVQVNLKAMRDKKTKIEHNKTPRVVIYIYIIDTYTIKNMFSLLPNLPYNLFRIDMSKIGTTYRRQMANPRLIHRWFRGRNIPETHCPVPSSPYTKSQSHV